MMVTLVFLDCVGKQLVLDVLESVALILQLVLGLQLVVLAKLLVELVLQLVLDEIHFLDVVLVVLEYVE